MEENNKLKRRRINPSHRWTDSEVITLLQAVSDAVKERPESFEKPTLEKFYGKIKENTPVLQNIELISFRSKMRYLKKCYISATEWKSSTGSGLLTNGEGTSVSDHVNKLCPQFHLLEEIFGQRKNVNPDFIYETNNNVNEVSISNSAEYLDLEILEDFSEETRSDTFVPEKTLTSPLPSTSQSALDFSQKQSKPKKAKPSVANPFANLLEIQKQRLEVEVDKLNLEKEKEKNLVELKKN